MNKWNRMKKEERDGEKKKKRLSLEVKNEITNPHIFFMPRFMTFVEWY
jgi:hypothetical protein